MAATPTVLCILDGWGCGASEVGNAPKLAKHLALITLWKAARQQN